MLSRIRHKAEDIWLNELLIDMFDDKSIVKVNAIVKSKEKQH